MRKITAIILLALLVLLAACALADEEQDITYHEMYNTPTMAPTATPVGYTPTPEPPPPTPIPTATPRYEADGSVVLTLTAVGDVTIGRNAKHSGSSIFEKELSRQGNDINFIFRNVKDILASDDVTIINFEGVLADEYSIPSKKKENSFLISENGTAAVTAPVAKTVPYTGSSIRSKGNTSTAHSRTTSRAL